jgi:putative NIF3 family GTP cyclohydrolase 1 type 2
MSLYAFVDWIQAQMAIKSVRTVGAEKMNIRTVAICTGSGRGLFKDFLKSDADVYLTGDVTYHDARMAEERQKAIVDIGHFASEHFFVDLMAEQLGEIAKKRQWDVAIEPCRTEKDPFQTH